MKRLYTLTALCLCLSILMQAQSLSPDNNSADKSLLKSGKSRMEWVMINNGTEIPIGTVSTEIQKNKDLTYIITTAELSQFSTPMIDSTVVKTKTFDPVYHSSYNQQRDMVLKFEEDITGYYFDKTTSTKTDIHERADASFFDSNFYPQLIRFLPLKKGYKTEISIFDYNLKAKVGIINATIKDVEESTLDFKDEQKQVWKVITTDEISNNTTTITYYIEKSTRELLKQELEVGSRKMVMRLIE